MALLARLLPTPPAAARGSELRSLVDDEDASSDDERGSDDDNDSEFYGAISCGSAQKSGTTDAGAASKKTKSGRRSTAGRPDGGGLRGRPSDAGAYAAISMPPPPVTLVEYHAAAQHLCVSVMKGDVTEARRALNICPAAVGFVHHGCSMVFHAVRRL